MLGDGEELRKLIITVEQLLDRSAKDIGERDGNLRKGLSDTLAVFTFLPKDGDVVSPCSSISVTVKRRKCESSDSLTSSVMGHHCVSRRFRFMSTPSLLITVCP